MWSRPVSHDISSTRKFVLKKSHQELVTSLLLEYSRQAQLPMDRELLHIIDTTGSSIKSQESATRSSKVPQVSPVVPDDQGVGVDESTFQVRDILGLELLENEAVAPVLANLVLHWLGEAKHVWVVHSAVFMHAVQ